MLNDFLNGRVIVKTGDITVEATDAIVNAANSTLLGGGGVDGAIHRAGGKEILLECQKIRDTRFPKGLPTGEAVITTGGMLPAKYVIHTVGPIYGMANGRESELLARSYTNSLKVLVENNLETIAFPSISTGAFYFPKHLAARIASGAVGRCLAENERIRLVNLVFFSLSDARMFLKHQTF